MGDDPFGVPRSDTSIRRRKRKKTYQMADWEVAGFWFCLFFIALFTGWFIMGMLVAE